MWRSKGIKTIYVVTYADLRGAIYLSYNYLAC